MMAVWTMVEIVNNSATRISFDALPWKGSHSKGGFSRLLIMDGLGDFNDVTLYMILISFLCLP